MTFKTKPRLADRSEAEQQRSSARHAAEAFFTPKQPAPPHSGSEVVVLRRKTRALLPQEAPAAAPEFEGDHQQLRRPTVHRLPARGLDLDGPSRRELGAEQSTSVNAQLDAPELNGSVPSEPQGPRRKRRRQLHGEVTIIRVAEGAKDLPVAPRPPTSTQPCQDPLAALLEYTPDYPKLMAQIRALQAAAQQVKAREAAEAIQWARRAIRAYRLTPRELGFQ